MTTSKQLWILTGGNGAGKSTFYKVSLLSKKGIKFINPDMIAKDINPNISEDVSYQAVYLAEQIREDFLSRGISFCFETVFSHPSKIDFLAKAKAEGYEIILVYIHLDTPELNEARVKQRVAEGGHHVPSEKIHSRLPRTLKNIAMALLLVDEARLLSNSSRENPFQQVALVKQGRRIKTIDPLPKWAEEILKAIP